MIQRRDFDTVGMSRLDWLLKLPGITEKNYALSGLRDSQNVCERHLSGLVDEEHIHAPSGVGPRPEPSRSAPYPAIGMQSIQKRGIVGRESQTRKVVFLVG